MIVTTASHPTPANLDRAALVAARCGVALVPRRGALSFGDDGLAYVVGRELDELRSRTGRLAVHVGLLHARVLAGAAHPLIAALSADGPVTRAVDATLGLAHDALHLAAVLGCDVVGIEGSSAMFSLLEEGLPRLAREEPAAARIEPRFGLAADVLATLPTGSVDAVYLSPMFEEPKKAVPGFELLRALALDAPLDQRTLDEARRVARGPIVVKVAPGQVLPVGREVRRIGKDRVQYVTLEP